MARYDVYANPSVRERPHTPFLLDVQNDFIDAIGSRVVIPLRSAADFGPPALRLNPVIEVDGLEYVLDTAALGAIVRSELRQPLANLRIHQPLIAEALDALFGAY
ncbi:CcdB family protein [Rivibacter subsaxonicus]|uniref:Toxin CcdB n=1 Tax=Rivibacter subsaxonicus TaxID=457575 RepID=A0A4Q7W1I9_9BURK|nr:CcdB family protein [Rivibacter subsaxonicus]RZU03142.1 toxin CcdB [Rivibacter subsaxonicus]